MAKRGMVPIELTRRQAQWVVHCLRAYKPAPSLLATAAPDFDREVWQRERGASAIAQALEAAREVERALRRKRKRADVVAFQMPRGMVRFVFDTLPHPSSIAFARLFGADSWLAFRSNRRGRPGLSTAEVGNRVRALADPSHADVDTDLRWLYRLKARQREHEQFQTVLAQGAKFA